MTLRFFQNYYQLLYLHAFSLTTLQVIRVVERFSLCEIYLILMVFESSEKLRESLISTVAADLLKDNNAAPWTN